MGIFYIKYGVNIKWKWSGCIIKKLQRYLHAE